MTNEGMVKKAVKKLLDRHEWFWWMTPANGFGKSGISDFCAIKHGVFIAIETKYGTNKPTPMQKAYLGSVMAQKGFAFVVSDRNIDALEKWLVAFDSSVQSVAENKQVSHEDGAGMLDAINALVEWTR